MFVFGDIFTVWEYELYKKSNSMNNFSLGFFLLTYSWWIPDEFSRLDAYWLFFVNGVLARWGRAGDWQPDVISQIKLDRSIKKE